MMRGFETVHPFKYNLEQSFIVIASESFDRQFQSSAQRISTSSAVHSGTARGFTGFTISGAQQELALELLYYEETSVSEGDLSLCILTQQTTNKPRVRNSQLSFLFTRPLSDSGSVPMSSDTQLSWFGSRMVLL